MIKELIRNFCLYNALRKVPKDFKLCKINKHNNLSIDMEFEDIENEEKNDNFSLATGMLGFKAMLILELKSIADVGPVAMPVLVKATFLVLSREPNHNAFTTLRPNIENLNYEDLSLG